MDENVLRIDGSYGEGGGSIIRFSMAFSALLKRPIAIYNIRANRKNPGLRTQHLVGIKLIQEIFGGNLQGAEVGSTTITYQPAENFTLKKKFYSVTIPTAASIGLIIQTLQLTLAHLHDDVTIEMIGGGTYGLWAPSIDYIKQVTLQYLKFYGCNFEIKVEKHGFYPKGGAKILLTLKSNRTKELPQLVSFTKKLDKPLIKGISLASYNLQRAKVAERTAESAKKYLEKYDFQSEIEVQYVESDSIGTGITIWTDSYNPFGSSFIGQKGISAEKVGQSVGYNFIKDWQYGGAVDEYMTDQIIPFMGLHATELTTGPLSNHTKTNMWIVNQFFSTNFQIEEMVKNLFKIRTTID